MGWQGMTESGAPNSENLGVPECPGCLRWSVHTPVERRQNTPMEYCTFHYWLMKGQEGFLLQDYVEHSRDFGFAVSLPSPDDIAEMKLAPELGMPELGRLLTLPEKLAAPGERLRFLPLRSVPLGLGRTSELPPESSRVSHLGAWAVSARGNPPPICVPA